MAASNGFLAGNGGNGIGGGGGVFYEDAGSGAEDKQPMLLMRKNGSVDGGHGITALINRQLQG